MDHHNKLSPEELEAISILAEECGETVQRIGKIMRHGLSSFHPVTRIGNVESLETELGDVCAAMEILSIVGVVDLANVERHMEEKLRKYAEGRGLSHLHHIRIPER